VWVPSANGGIVMGVVRFWREHSLTILLTGLLVLVFALSLWATWHEYRDNEALGPRIHSPFSVAFTYYWLMQVGTNYAAELMGLITITLLTKRFRERFSSEG
jgi:hypothetical protein